MADRRTGRTCRPSGYGKRGGPKHATMSRDSVKRIDRAVEKKERQAGRLEAREGEDCECDGPGSELDDYGLVWKCKTCGTVWITYDGCKTWEPTSWPW